MKKNCFIYSVILGTVMLAALIYLIENQFSDLFLDEGKKFIIKEIESDWNKNLAYVKNSEEKDSLRILLKEFILQFNKPGDFIIPSEANNDFISSAMEAFEDSLVTTDEIKVITELFLKVKNEELQSD